jgi:hypothetical protein
MEGVAMPRDRWRATLESGPKLDLAKLIRRGAGKPDTNIICTLIYASGERVIADIKLRDHGGWMDLSHSGRQQTFSLVSSPRHFGGLHWYAVRPRTRRRFRVFFRPLGATYFASRHAWGRSAAYASQFLDPIGRAWRTKVKVKSQPIGDEDPDEWDLPPKSKGLRWATYERWVSRYDAAEYALDTRIALAAAQLMKRK